MVTLADAVPPRPSFTVTVTGTGPTTIGAVHGVCRLVGLVSEPELAVHRYARGSPSGSWASAETVETLPTSTVHGSHAARTVGGRLAGGGGGTAAAFVGAEANAETIG